MAHDELHPPDQVFPFEVYACDGEIIIDGPGNLKVLPASSCHWARVALICTLLVSSETSVATFSDSLLRLSKVSSK